jgi:hypothetical protein
VWVEGGEGRKERRQGRRRRRFPFPLLAVKREAL